MEQLHTEEIDSRTFNQHRKVYAVLFALFSVLLAYLFTHLIPLVNVPLGTIIFTVLLFCGTLIYGIINGSKIKLRCLIAMLCGLIFSSYHFLNGIGSSGSYYPVFLLTLMAYGYFVYVLFSNEKAGLPGAAMLLEWLQAVVMYPFQCFPAMFLTIFRREKSRKGNWKPFFSTVIGILIALLLGFAVVQLLSFDENFKFITDQIKSLFVWDFDRVFEVFVRLMFALPCAALLFGMVHAAANHKNPGFASQNTVNTIADHVHVIPFVIVAIPAAMLILIYGLFFFSQMPYYISAFSRQLPAAYSAADYARNGFFELCGVASINAGLSLLLNLFTKHSGRAINVLRKIIIALFSLETLILITTALSKMLLYMERFDLTLTRLWPTFFLCFLAVGFLTLIVSLFWKKVKVLPILLSLGILFAAVYPFCQVPKRVAAYNVDAYFAKVQDGKEAEVDVFYLHMLGEAAVPELVRLYNNPLTDEETRQKVKETLETMASPDEWWNPVKEQWAQGEWYLASVFTAERNQLLSQFNGKYYRQTISTISNKTFAPA